VPAVDAAWEEPRMFTGIPANNLFEMFSRSKNAYLSIRYLVIYGCFGFSYG